MYRLGTVFKSNLTIVIISGWGFYYHSVLYDKKKEGKLCPKDNQRQFQTNLRTDDPTNSPSSY